MFLRDLLSHRRLSLFPLISHAVPYYIAFFANVCVVPGSEKKYQSIFSSSYPLAVYYLNG